MRTKKKLNIHDHGQTLLSFLFFSSRVPFQSTFPKQKLLKGKDQKAYGTTQEPDLWLPGIAE